MRDGNDSGTEPILADPLSSGPRQAVDQAPGSRVPDLTGVRDPEPASVHVIVTGSRTRIVISGEIDADLAPDLLEATTDAEVTGLPIDVDAQYVTFMDSSGIAFLARLASRSSERVRVLRAPETVRFLLEVTRIGELLELVDDEDEDASYETGHDPSGPAVVASDDEAAPPDPDGAA